MAGERKGLQRELARQVDANALHRQEVCAGESVREGAALASRAPHVSLQGFTELMWWKGWRREITCVVPVACRFARVTVEGWRSNDTELVRAVVAGESVSGFEPFPAFLLSHIAVGVRFPFPSIALKPGQGVWLEFSRAVFRPKVFFWREALTNAERGRMR